jgi:hypothetical protein
MKLTAFSGCFSYPLGPSKIAHTVLSIVFSAVPFAFMSDFPYSEALQSVFTVFHVLCFLWPLVFMLGFCKVPLFALSFAQSVIVVAF